MIGCLSGMFGMFKVFIINKICIFFHVTYYAIYHDESKNQQAIVLMRELSTSYEYIKTYFVVECQNIDLLYLFRNLSNNYNRQKLRKISLYDQ